MSGSGRNPSNVRKPPARWGAGRLDNKGSPSTAAPIAQDLHSPKWLIGFVAFEFSCQLILLIPAISAERGIVRVAAFGASLGLLLVLRGTRESHPAWRASVAGLAVIGASILHPTTNTVAAGIATGALGLAVVAPIFWVPRIRIGVDTVRHLFTALWLFNTASAFLGALQVYYPGRFEPVTSTILSDETVAALHITLANGAIVPRPMGLTDTPGGAGVGGAYAVLLATALLIGQPRPLFRAALVASMAIGCFTLYLTQIRSLLVMLVIGLLAMAMTFALQRRSTQVITITFLAVGAAFVAFLLASAIGGDAVTKRLSTLIDDDPRNVYYSNRGIFLSYTFGELLPQYPLGAGLGRWGMIVAYFGDPFNSASKPIWAEIQWTGWLLDGGIPLMLAYALGLLVSLREALRTALRRDAAAQQLQVWSAALFGYSLGAVALTFNSCPFATTIGLEFWMLNATIFAASRQLPVAETQPLVASGRIRRQFGSYQ